MSNNLIYSINIYLLLFILFHHNKNSIVYDENNNLKSWDFFCKKFNKWKNVDDFVTFPSMIVLLVIFSFLLAKQINN